MLDSTLLIFVVLVSDFGVLSVADGVIAALMIGLARPALLPYLLLLVGGFQDARGLSTIWWYGGCVLLLLMLFFFRTRTYLAYVTRMTPPAKRTFIMACVTVVYAVVSSYIFDLFGIHPQSPEREPIIVATLDLAMIMGGTLAYSAIVLDRSNVTRVQIVLILLFGNGVILSLARLIWGFDLFYSPSGLEAINDVSEQLIEQSAIGLPRLTGTYLTPTGYAMYIGYLFLLYLLLRGGRLTGKHILAYVMSGIGLAIMSLSKSMAMYFLGSSLSTTLVTRRYLFIPVAVYTFLLLAVIYLIGFDNIVDAFRVESGTSDESYRWVVWKLVIDKFGIQDWLLGTGIGHWKVFMERELHFTLSDPHNYLLSIPGTYGLLGVITYVILFFGLLRVVISGSGVSRFVSLSMMFAFFIIDLTNIPYFIGNTPLTLLIWTALTGVMSTVTPVTLSINRPDESCQVRALAGTQN